MFLQQFLELKKEDLKPTPYFTLVQFDNLKKKLLFNAFLVRTKGES